MKIAKASVIITSPGRNFVTLKVETDEGIYGLGDATLNGRELAVASYLTDHVIPCILGRDPFQTEDIWQYLYRGAYWRRGPVTMTAIAAVDVALWDIKGKALNTPVYNLLGGKSLQTRRSDLRVVPHHERFGFLERQPNPRSDCWSIRIRKMWRRWLRPPGRRFRMHWSLRIRSGRQLFKLRLGLTGAESCQRGKTQ